MAFEGEEREGRSKEEGLKEKGNCFGIWSGKEKRSGKFFSKIRRFDTKEREVGQSYQREGERVRKKRRLLDLSAHVKGVAKRWQQECPSLVTKMLAVDAQAVGSSPRGTSRGVKFFSSFY